MGNLRYVRVSAINGVIGWAMDYPNGAMDADRCIRSEPFAMQPREADIMAMIFRDYGYLTKIFDDEAMGDLIDPRIGMLVEVLHCGRPTGIFGTIVAIRNDCFEVKPEGWKPGDFPLYDYADAFRILEST